MCEKCTAAVKELFPDKTEEEQVSILWNFTPFPFGTAEEVRAQLQKLAESEREASLPTQTSDAQRAASEPHAQTSDAQQAQSKQLRASSEDPAQVSERKARKPDIRMTFSMRRAKP